MLSGDVFTPSLPPSLPPPQEEEGICTSKEFSEAGMIDLLERAAQLFQAAHSYEAVAEVYKIVMPIYEALRSHAELEKVLRP